MPRAMVVVTRPQPEALQWQHLLQAQGVPAAALPLIEIAPAQDAVTPQKLRAVQAQLPGYRALMFVSSNAVRGLLATPGMAADVAAALQAGHTRAWAPGPGTRQALLEAGLPGHAIDSPPADAVQFDSEALWAVVGPHIAPQDRILIVRGASQDRSTLPEGSGREWLAQQLRAAGAQVELLGVYARQRPAPAPALLAAIEAHCAHRDWWLFSSSEAIAHLQQLCPQRSWHTQRALTTHPRIAAAAQHAGFGMVKECKPDVRAVVASIESAP